MWTSLAYTRGAWDSGLAPQCFALLVVYVIATCDMHNQTWSNKKWQNTKWLPSSGHAHAPLLRKFCKNACAGSWLSERTALVGLRGPSRWCGLCCALWRTICTPFSLVCLFFPLVESKMSWDSYIDNLKGSGHVLHGCIVGQAGGVWAASPALQGITPTETAALTKSFADPSTCYANGLKFCGKKYMFLRPSTDGFALYGKKGSSEGCCVAKTVQTIVIGVYGEGMQAGSCNIAVEKIAEYLRGTGYWKTRKLTGGRWPAS